MAKPKIGVIVDRTPLAQECFQHIQEAVVWCTAEEADIVVVIGGDGFMLQAMHRFYHSSVQLYGINAGTVGFLLNRRCMDAEKFCARLNAAVAMRLTPLKFAATDMLGAEHIRYGFNEIALFRESRQALKLSIDVDGVPRLLDFVGDGVLVATPAGSTALNMSVGGPVLPLDANLLSMAAMGAFRPRRWPGALISRKSEVTITVREPKKRPASVSADFAEVRDLVHIVISESSGDTINLLFDPEQTLGERIMKEQFAV